MKYNNIDMEKWKESDVNVDSLWIIEKRKRSGKHRNIYHGNFVPQIPYQLIQRYTCKGDTVLDIFLGSGTTFFECENLGRNFIGFDINEEMIAYVKQSMGEGKSVPVKYYIGKCDVTNAEMFEREIAQALRKLEIQKVQLIIIHPPYLDIINFTEKNEDLSNIGDLDEFLKKFTMAVGNSLKFLQRERYFGVVIGDVYKNKEVIPLSFYCMEAVKRNFAVNLKGIIVKNIEGNKGKLGKSGIWRYRALKSDYYIFKHEYIFVFKLM